VIKDSSYLDFFKTKGNRWRLAIIISLGIISQYSGNALFSNYTALIYKGAGISDDNQTIPVSGFVQKSRDSELTAIQLNGGNTILSLIVSVSASLTIDKFGRRPLFLISTAGMVVMFICWTITGAIYENSDQTNKAAGIAQLPFIWLFGVFYSFAWSGLLVAYALEVLPFKLRAKGLMIMNITVQAILAIGK
jgi:MFS family permease